MEAKDLPRVEQLFHTVLELDAAERADYLDRECKGEPELRVEVESLIATFEKRADFLEEPVFRAGLQAFVAAESAGTLLGKQIGPYKMQRLLGKGGMGEVYLAEDTRLGRPVALKFLAPHMSADQWARRQLVKEAQAVAMLDHPNICTVFGFEEADGHSFIVMQYVEGQTLSDLIHAAELPGKQLMPLALQMVGALADAHQHGVIHRDIKPQNMILSSGGQLKVLDFGLAKVIQGKAGTAAERPSQASQKGLIAGTVAYMSPEQLRAERLDFRTDIFSVGTVLYELVSGKHPFARASDAETIAAILSGEPEETPPRLNGLQRGFDRVVRKCLEKDRERRYPSASALLLDLQTIEPRASTRWTHPRLNPYLAVIVLALVLAAIFGLYARLTSKPTIVIFPFINEGAGDDLDYLVSGLPESIAGQLSRLSRVKVKALEAMADKKRQLLLSDPKRSGKELGADAFLLGKATKQGQTIELETQLIAFADPKKSWTKKFDLKKTDALAIQETLALNMTSTLGGQLSAEDKKLVEKRQTTNPEAFQEYLLGRFYYNRRNGANIQLAITHFQNATELDREYARAYSGLADSHILLSSVIYGQAKTKDAVGAARSEVTAALALDPTLAEAQTSLGVLRLLYDRNWREAENAFKRAIELNPSYPLAHSWYANLLMAMNRQGEAVVESEIAQRLEPFSPVMNEGRCRALYWTRQFSSADDCLKEMLTQDPKNSKAQYILGFSLLAQNQLEPALEIFRKLYAIKEGSGIAPLGHTLGRLGRREEALKLLARAQELTVTENLPPQEIAIIYIGLGDLDQAFLWLNKAADEHFPYLIYVNIEPVFKSIRDDHRYAALKQRLKL
jgi:eukaryotic-like serine/threonine-protein kinase